MATATDSDIQALQADLKQLRTDFASPTETLRDLVRNSGAEAAAKARDTGERVWNEAKRHVNTVRQEIEEKPLTSAVAAFGIGVVLGLLFSRRG